MKRLNLSRWNFIKWAGVVGLALVALCQKEACAQTALPVVGAIRWDAWQEGGTVQAAVETDLSPYHWHHRVPFFGRVTGSNSVSINGNTQTIMDQEIDYAANAGLGYWAFVIYPDNSGMSRALHLYLKSSRRDRIRFACLVQGTWAATGSEDWNTQVERYVSYFQNPTYQKVQGNRPLFYLFGKMDGTTRFTNIAAVATAFAQLRSATTNAGLGSPYIVFQGWNAASDYVTIQGYGLDALGAYAMGGGSSTGTPYSSLAAKAHAFWDAGKATGTNVVPIVTSGWDNRPRYENPTPWDSGGTNYFLAPAPAELANHLTDALGWASSNRCSTTPANTVLIYAWNEHDEGGWICPTLNTNDWVSPDASRLEALGLAIASFSPQVCVLNPSFETPPVNGGWYVVPSGGMPPSFGWSNNFSAGVYVLASSNALHFSAAAEGGQAILFNAGKYISQDTGSTAPDKLYTLTFSLLQDKYTPIPSSVLQAQVFDGANLLAATNATVPAATDVWQTLTLTARSPQVPAGHLVLKFTGVSGNPWLDKVSLTTAGLPSAPPTITGAPLSRTNQCGSTATFTVAASGTAPLSYQWYFNGVTLTNATGTTLTWTNVQAAHQGSYTVIVSNFAGSVTSLVATLTVLPPPTIRGQLDLGVFTLSFATAPGSTYMVEFKQALSDPLWEVMTNVAGTGSLLTFSDSSLTNAARFYRVRIQ